MLPGSLGQSSSHIVKNTVVRCAVLRRVHISTWKNGFRVLSPKDQMGPSRRSSVTEAKGNICHGIWVHQCKWHGWLAYVWRYHWHGGIYWSCTEKYTAVKMMSFMRSSWLLDQDNASSHSAHATTAWFRDRETIFVPNYPSVRRPLIQIASSHFSSLSVHCGCHTETS